MLSVIIPVRNRGGIRLQNCLRSLRWQDTPEETEILISDFGSDEREAERLCGLASELDASVVRSATRSLWNRSAALNVGIRASKGEYVLCTDADMIFAPNFLSTLLRRLREPTPVLVVCQCLDLPCSVPEQLHAREAFAALRRQATPRRAGSLKRPESMGTGACHGAARSFFERIRGYDEGYVYWGCEDGDLVARALHSGLRLSWIEDETAMLHQWHPTLRRRRRWLYYKNRMRFRFTRHRVVKNPTGWGERVL